MRFSPPANPRNLLPSRAHPEHRQARKELEKEHPFSFAQVATLGLIGLTLAWDMEKQVRKHEERKEKEEAEQKRRGEQERRRREKSSYHNRTVDSRRDHRAPDSSRTSNRGASESYARDSRRRQSVDYRRADTRREDGCRGPVPRYGDPIGFDLTGRGRSRRDSW
ncbi:hypothetical protein F4823DRAFT_616524 [Ustulina deusta]|nr:hypothetical protein F4823DRAFT_616524 [Ustulina deusta]